MPRPIGAARRYEATVCDPRSPGDHRGALGAPGVLGRPGGGPSRPKKSAEELFDPGGGAGGYGDADSDARAGVAAALGAGAWCGADDAGEVLVKGLI